MTGKIGNDFGRDEVFEAQLRAVLIEGGANDLRPMVRMDAAAVTPCTNGDGVFPDVGGERFGVSAPGFEDFG